MKMCPEDHLPVSKTCACLIRVVFSHLLTLSIRSHVSMDTSALVFFDSLPSVLLVVCTAGKETSQ